jgi:hypothetical protein
MLLELNNILNLNVLAVWRLFNPADFVFLCLMYAGLAGIAYGAAVWLMASSYRVLGVAAYYPAITTFITPPLAGWVFIKVRHREISQ